jgi:hypothetical protein
MALPVIDAVLSDAKRHLPPGDPVLESLRDLISPEAIAANEPLRAVDAWLVVGQLVKALERAGPPTSRRYVR